MPIVASRGGEIRKLISELADPKRRAGATLRLKALGARVVPHVADELGRLDADARRALLTALEGVDTADAKALRKRLARVEPPSASESSGPSRDAEARALDALRALPPPRANERPTVSRERGEAHLALARAGSRLARKDLLLSLAILPAERSRVYCEAATLIGDADFLEPLARIATVQRAAATAIASICSRQKIGSRSKALRTLDEPLRLVVARALAGTA